MDILVDSNVILDIVTEDKTWFSWSSETLAECSDHHRLVINPIIYAEVSIGFECIEDLEEILPVSF
jgi:predicted nucleic acid-binding protein